MSTKTDIRDLYDEFEKALAEMLTAKEHAHSHRARLQYARLRLASHPDLDPVNYKNAVDRAFKKSTLAGQP